ncbi:flippase-like domain-containing protein [Jonesiaceae bacterium BS-20]|uniref:Flippase-like domain-containing protein n=1 Tax=Jonesiaceae bacterium BS-20 TaxID=3120821 RepID=A0AAU7DWH9_9MICO
MSFVDRPRTESHDVGSYYQPPTASDVSFRDDKPATPKIYDAPEPRVRQPRDVLGIVLAILGIVALLILTVYAQRTTQGVQADVQSIMSVVAKVLQVPVVLLEFLVTLFVPVAVLTELTIRRMGRQVVEAALALVVGLLLAAATVYAITMWGAGSLNTGLSVHTDGRHILSVPSFVAGLAGLLTAAGPRTRRRTVAFSWNLLWVTLSILLITVQISLPGVLIALLIGRVAGLSVRYASGVSSERATGDALVKGIQQAGFDPLELRRIGIELVGPDGEAVPQPETETTTGMPVGDSTGKALTRYSDTRVYAMTPQHGPRLDVVVLDGDRQVIGILQRLWRSFRVRGIEGRSAISLRAVAERAALLIYAASAAGVRTPTLRGVSTAEDSMLLILEHPQDTVTLTEAAPETITDAVMDEAWRQLGIAHDAGITHRSLSTDAILLTTATQATDEAPTVWIAGWQSGDVASAPLTRGLDNAQMLALFALAVGAEHAISSARKVLSESELAAVGPLLQTVVLPGTTRAQLRGHKNLMGELRAALIKQVPDASIEPQPLTRISPKKLVTLLLTIVVIAVVFTSINFDQITLAVRSAQPWWMALSFALGLLTWLGAAMTFVGFAPVKLPLTRATLVQAAASFVALAAPAGIGPAALNLRMLTRRGVTTSLALATVALVQVSGFVVTIVLLLVLSLISGESGSLRALPSTTVITVITIVTLAGTAILSVPVLRRWIWNKVSPTLTQIWPRVSELLGTPWRLTLGIAGNVILTLGYILAFNAALAAFGQQVTLIDAALVYLVGNTIGALAPTPGGLGAIEVALITGLTTTAATPAAIATSAVVLFRVVTYWARIPLGWIAMQYLQRKGDL